VGELYYQSAWHGSVSATSRKMNLNGTLARYRLCIIALASTRGEAGLSYLDF
jgi:hypothetical protein